MPDFNAHGLNPTWAEPEAERVQTFFDNLSERAEEAALAKEAGSIGAMEDEADTAAEEKELAEWAGSAGEASSASTGACLVEDVAEESAEEEAEADDSSAQGRKCVLRRASSGEPVRPDRTTQQQLAQAQPADFDLGSFSPKRKRRPEEEDEDTETLAQRAAKRAKASMGDKPPASTLRTPVVVEEDINVNIEEVAKDAEAEAAKIAAGEAAKSAAEEAAKGLAGEAGEAATGEASKGPARESSEAAAEEALHRARQDKVKSRMAAVDKAEADFEERIAQTHVLFGKAREELRTAQGELDERKRELILKQADIEKA
nr:tol-Pal system protein TolA-like [Aegilops tauschii subsp. strangulata]